ncbi:MAG: ferritin family protein [Betaproteobacteria bacterium]|nr:ferritin family protein [Betaproteobacteria bacterium]
MSTKQSTKRNTKAVSKKGARKSTKKSTKVSTKKTKAAAKPKSARAPKHAAAKAAAKAAPVASASEFMVHAYAMEAEAAERYAEFADSMEMHNNHEVAELFRKLSRIEQRHADQILEQMGWKQSPASSAGYRWEGTEGPETADPTELHYLMQPYHALQIALHNEKRARDFFAHLAKVATNAGVRKGALEMREEEAEHVRLIEEWLKRTPVPGSNWETDQDPPVLSD